MQEFKVLASASNADQLRHIVRPETFEQFGEPFTPEFVYDAIRQLSRFASMEVSKTYHLFLETMWSVF